MSAASQMMEKEEEVVELKRRMGELVRLVEHFEETRPDAQEEKQPQVIAGFWEYPHHTPRQGPEF